MESQTALEMLHTALRRLARARRSRDLLLQESAEAIQALHDTDEWQAWTRSQQAERETAQGVSALEKEVKDLAIAAYDGQHKTVTPGVGIRVSHGYAYNEALAMAWAKEHAPDAVVLDHLQFEKQLTVARELPKFVTVTERVSAAIGSDLSGLLEAEQEPAHD